MANGNNGSATKIVIAILVGVIVAVAGSVVGSLMTPVGKTVNDNCIKIEAIQENYNTLALKVNTNDIHYTNIIEDILDLKVNIKELDKSLDLVLQELKLRATVGK